ncbi:hypothetical protein EG19_12395 [Thermoanaerobaculum aquaticum]|uniref:Cytochrome c7-like domain-containing protein n=1 Tax=Thermoanaerobaculum aquaticum TaxID=1312852 RepID=A0A062Y0I5_9BACT|nr:hypothetical protein EG19_12395 [Thermoanaerobaculum aquaticum]
MSERTHNRLVKLLEAALLLLLGLSPGWSLAQGQTQQPNHAPPEELLFRSPVGTVSFPHALHVSDLGAACTDCHHPAAAPALNTPHPQWLPKAGHQCLACHGKKETLGKSYGCGGCHSQTLPAGHTVIPSRKVAIHLACGLCHEMGQGKDASKACVSCHAGEKAPW